MAHARRVLDPFCGRGTTNFAARLLGMRSVGIDSNPVAAAIAEGKMVATTASDIVAECSAILAVKPKSDPPEGQFWSLCYHPSTLNQLSYLRTALLNDCNSPERRALRALFVGPKEIMLDAIYGAPCKLRILTIRSAGLSTKGKRQADQFRRRMRKPIEELDFYIRLEEPFGE